MFKKILIANRGEIAVRIIRACKEMGIQTVAVYSEVDKASLHVKLADQAVCIGKASPQKSYLNIENIISATVLTGAEAIHPGFGFLSENSKFASICKECGIEFIGPTAEMIDKMGNKSEARKTMIEAGVPVVPGSKGKVRDIEDGLKIAEEIGYPVMIKASAGGGGRGMRIAYDKEKFESAFNTAKSESKKAFGDDTMYVEKYVENPKHIEFQILADKYGHVIHLGERDCSIQRRHQKVLEEAPSKVISKELRDHMGSVAVKAAESIKYHSVGTIEFLLDKHGHFYFIEMNTRIQVEHPITELITGIDLIKEQIKVAFGEELQIKQEDVKINGHAIECRINAENPEQNFMPSPGRITELKLPGGNGVRIDSQVYSGYMIPPNYDSMIAKLIVHDKTREEAINKMKSAIDELEIEGVNTNIEFQKFILNQDDFVEGKYDTAFIANHIG